MEDSFQAMTCRITDVCEAVEYEEIAIAPEINILYDWALPVVPLLFCEGYCSFCVVQLTDSYLLTREGLQVTGEL